MKNSLHATALAMLAAVGVAAPAHAWVSTPAGSLPIKTSVASQQVAGDMPVHLIVSLNLQHQDQLKAFLKNVRTPGNPAYGQFMTPAQFSAHYSPTVSQAQPVMDYLKTQGFSHISISENHVLVTAEGNMALAQKAFNTQVRQFAYNGKIVHLPISNPQVPDALSGIVLGVHGLQTVAEHTTHSQRSLANDLPAPYRTGVQLKATPSGAAPGVPSGPLPKELYTAADFRKAYNADGIVSGGDTVVSIVSAGTDLHQVVLDLAQAEKDANLPFVPVEIHQVAAVPDPQATDNDGEWDLDSQSSSGIAYNVQKIIFLNATDLGDSLLMAYADFLTADPATGKPRSLMGNMSYGGCEVLDQVLGGQAPADALFMQATAQGQTWFASSGDAGAACTVAVNLATPQSGVPDQIECPACSPYVVAVGGTSLYTLDDGSYDAEISWTATGGGTSTFETAPDWQAPAGVIGAETGLRGVPDIAMNAGFNLSPAAAFYATADTVVNGRHGGYIGTSLSSPLAMGVWARMQSAHCNALGFAAPIFYGLDTAGGPTSTATGFHDVIVGTNGGFTAAPGWDYNTGFGSFDIPAVNAALPAATCAADQPPVAKLSVSGTSGSAPYKVSFDGSSSSDPDSGDKVAYYVVDFGDGSAPVVQTTPVFPAHEYDSPGAYVASLSVRDTHGAVSNLAATQGITIVGVPLTCTAPGPVVLTSPEGSPSLEGVDPQMGNGSDDLLYTNISEPVDLDNKLVVTMKMVSLATVPNLYRWVTYFSTTSGDYYVSMATANGAAPTYTYGLHGTSAAGTGTFAYLGDLDASSTYNADGTITLVLDKALIPIKAGDKLTNISSSVRTAIPDDTVAGTAGGTGLTIDSGGAPNPYNVISNAICKSAALTTTTPGTPVTTGSPGTPATPSLPVTTAPTAMADGRFGGGAMGLGLLPLLLVAARRRRKTRV